VQLTEAQRAAFYRDGNLEVAGAVTSEPLDRVLAAINADLGRGLDPERIDEFYARSFCPELRNSAPILDLFRSTPARELADALLAPGRVRLWPGGHQLYERYFQTHDVREMVHGTPQLEQLPDPMQLRVNAGDIVLAHYQLGHTGAPNLSARIR